jgi:polyhydroxyalkanoate synthesis regulator phasin
MRPGKKWLVIALAAVILAGLATAALADSQTDTGLAPQALQAGEVFLDKLAGVLGIERAKLDEALKTAGDQTIDHALQEGKITQEQADKLRSRVDQGWPFFGCPKGGAWDSGGKIGHGGLSQPLADALGITLEDLQAALKEGKTVADLAAGKGLTVEQVQDKILADVKLQLDQAVKDGKLTQDKADEAYTSLEQRIKSGDWTDQLGKHGLKFQGKGRPQAQPQQ